MDKTLRKMVLVSMVIIALVWAGYTLFYPGWRIPCQINQWALCIGLLVTAFSPVFNGICREASKRYRGKEKLMIKRLNRATVVCVVVSWVYIFLVHLGGYFDTVAIHTISGLLVWVFGRSFGWLWWGYIIKGDRGLLRMGVKGVLVGCALSYGFYSLYYFDGPYCDSWGFAIAAGVTTVLVTFLALRLFCDQYDTEESG